MALAARRYSLSEIDRMRDDVTWMRRHRDPVDRIGGRGFPSKPDSVEEELRTLMGAGVTAGEIGKQRKEREERRRLHAEWEDAKKEIGQRFCSHPIWQDVVDDPRRPFCTCHHYYYNYKPCSCPKVKCCTRCDLRDRRVKSQGRPGGRRKADKAIVEKAKTDEFLSAPMPPVKIVQFGDSGGKAVVATLPDGRAVVGCDVACCPKKRRRRWLGFLG